MALQIETSKPTDQSPIVGIDLGTTHSLVAFVKDGVPEVLTTREGRRLIPSVVAFDDERPRIGYSARHKKVLQARDTVFSVKRLLGRGFKDLEAAARSLPYEILPGEEGPESMVRIRAGSRTYTPVEISAMILRECKAAAEQALGVSVSRAVITVPAYFNDSQRQATRAAGRIAGLDVLRIINEPTAASLAYGLDRKREGLIAVYDLGGGTFDLSILKLHEGIFEVLSTNGNTSLGGDDLDQAIAAVCVREIQDQFGFDPTVEPEVRAALIEAAEKVKIELSERESTTMDLEIETVQNSAGSKVRYLRKWTRSEFESLARPVLERTRGPCERALVDAGIQVSDLSDVVLVGGPTRLPIVQKMAEEIFGRKPNSSMHPDEVVAIGAAIQADILAGHNKELLLLDVVPLSLGLETYGGLMSTLIPRNTRIPTVAKEQFTTFVDRQTGVDIHVLQGEREKVEDNRSLARFKLKGIRPAPAGTPRIEVTFLIDADGILQVAAKDLETGNEQAIEVRPSYGLTDDQVESMLNESYEHAEEDILYRKLAEAKNEVEPVLRNTEKRLEQARRLLPPQDYEHIEQRLIGLRTALQGRDPDQIRLAGKGLSEVTVRLAELVIKEALEEAGKGES